MIRQSIDHSILSPSGRVSKRARKAAMDRATAELFAPWGGHLPRPCGPAQSSEKDRDLQQAARLRDLAARGMCRRKYTKEADALEAKWTPESARRRVGGTFGT